MGFKNEKFLKVKYYAFGGSGSGASAADPASPVDSNICQLAPGLVIEGVDVVVTVSITGATQLDVGDEDDQNGYVAAAALTAGQPVVGGGAYVASGAKKYYSALKNLKLDMTGAVTAGAFFVVAKGYQA